MMLFCTTRDLAGHETLEDEWYVVINVYKLTIFDIWRDFLYYHIMCVCAIRTYRVYQLYDTTSHSYTLIPCTAFYILLYFRPIHCTPAPSAFQFTICVLCNYCTMIYFYPLKSDIKTSCGWSITLNKIIISLQETWQQKHCHWLVES